MKKFNQYLFAGLSVLALSLPLAAAAAQTEDQVLTEMASPKESKVISALQHFEKDCPSSDQCLTKAKSLLTDDRPAVREKAARVLGVLHSDLTDDELASIAKMLDSATPKEVDEALQALRGLKAKSTVPKIVAALKNPDDHVKRDACRTLAVLGDKSNIADIKPLLQDPSAAVVKDANDAIYALNNK